MPVTTLDPKTALISIDLQKGIVAMAPPEVMGGVLKNAGALAKAFREKSLPVVLVNVAGVAPGRTEQSLSSGREFPPDFAELVPELDAQPQDLRVTKKTWGAFTNTQLEEQLRALGVTQVVILGVATSIGVESTARFAYELGFNVTLVTDAMADLRPEAHASTISLIFPRLGETGTTADILALLAKH